LTIYAEYVTVLTPRICGFAPGVRTCYVALGQPQFMQLERIVPRGIYSLVIISFTVPKGLV
jgi:hypothetical protein